MKLSDIKFKNNNFDAQWLIDLHNMETGDDKALEEFKDICEPPLVVYTSVGTITGWLDKGWLFKFVEWLDKDLYLDLMKLAVDSLGWANVKQS